MKLVIAHENAELVKRDEEAQREQMDQRCPREKTKGTQELISVKHMGQSKKKKKKK